MNFTYIQEINFPNGQKETTSQEFAQSTVTLGRGGNSDIIFDSKLVSLEHARISIRDSKLYIEDLDSISGIRINDFTTTGAFLQNGDIIKLGDVTIKVFEVEGNWGVFEERVVRIQESAEDKATRLAKNLFLPNLVPSLKFWSVVLTAVVMVLYFFLPVAGYNKDSWSAGPISNNHAMIEGDCSSCHTKVFHEVEDKACLSCHNLTDHAEALPEILAKNSHYNVPCQDCHLEHNGDKGVVVNDDKLCSGCHSDIAAVHAETKSLDVKSWNSHPQFEVMVFEDDGAGNRVPKKVSLDDKKSLVDSTHIKLNHKVHLAEGLKGADGPVTMQCSDCHHLADNFKDVLPISFERDCQSCHPLTFDDRMPEIQAPHGDADTVYNYMYAEYAKLALGKEVPGREELNVRRKPGYQQKVQPSQVVEFADSNIADEARRSEQLVFEKTACYLCHDVSKKSDEPGSLKVSAYEVIKPEIPTRWMPASIFDHGAHEEVLCESCHKGVRQSENTSDVLMAGKEACVDCHYETDVHGKVESNCITCHSYHDSLPYDYDKKRSIHEILYSLGADTKG